MSRPKLVFASRNRGKLVELQELLADLDVEVVSVADLEPAPEVVEDGDTFAANASKKAMEVAKATGLPALADDSGLEVDALEGRPGVLSARFAGPEATDDDNNRLLVRELEGVAAEYRGARFRSVLAFADPSGRLGDEVLLAEGICEGQILAEARGSGGFGYDPLFLVPDMGKTFAELGVGTKNDRSHRALAMRAMKPRLAAYYGLAMEQDSR